MLRRCIWELSSARSICTRHRAITAQTPFFLSSRNEFSTTPQRKPPPGARPSEETSGSGSSLPKILFGSVFVVAAVMAADQTGYINLRDTDGKSRSNLDAATTLEDSNHSDDPVTVLDSKSNDPSTESPGESKSNKEVVEKIEHHHLEDFKANTETVLDSKSVDQDTLALEKNELSSLAKDTISSPDDQTVGFDKSAEGNLHKDNDSRPHLEENKLDTDSEIEEKGTDIQVQVSKITAASEDAPPQATDMQMPKVSIDDVQEAPKSLGDSYSLYADEVSSVERDTDPLAAVNEKEISVAQSGSFREESKLDGEKILLDLIEAIHTAERRQAETDAYIYGEEKRKLKEKYEKLLRDARARELMYAEEAAILDKELNKEKVKAAAMVKSLQEKAEQQLQEELKRKEEAAEMELKKAQELAKAELAAAIASEKASQIEKIAEANLNINALCMAFYARSEEARESHSVHKIALGTLALEDALSKGLPLRAEVLALHESLNGTDRDSFLDLVLSSLPEEALNSGTDTNTQLNQEFDSLKGSLRHFSLIPAGGGGLLTHTVAQIASSIKMREDQSGDGIESLISKVEYYLVQGKFAEAADALEGGVRGTEAEKVIIDWVKQARNRAVVEQALSLLQSYATSITFS